MVLVLPSQIVFEGLPVDEVGLKRHLDERQELNTAIGAGRQSEVILQVASGVSEDRVQRVVAELRSAGFVDVTRIAIPRSSSSNSAPKH
jgi:hypothetical protein